VTYRKFIIIFKVKLIRVATGMGLNDMWIEQI